MKKLFAFLIIACVFALFADDPKIEVVPMEIQVTNHKVERLTDRKEFDKNWNTPPQDHQMCKIELDIAFLVQKAYPVIKGFGIESVKTNKNKILKCNPIWGALSIINNKKVCEAKLMMSADINSMPEKLSEIKGSAIIEEYSIKKIEVKNILSYAGKKIENKEFKKFSLSVRILVFDETIEVIIFGPNYWPLSINENIIEFNPPIQNYSMGSSQKGKNRTTTFRGSAEGLNKNSSMILNLFIPGKEITVPFTLKNIKVPK
jgi:hypothetical protein